jgi:hypothetical protein
MPFADFILKFLNYYKFPGIQASSPVHTYSRTTPVKNVLKALYIHRHAVAESVEALRYKPEGLGFDWNISLT